MLSYRKCLLIITFVSLAGCASAPPAMQKATLPTGSQAKKLAYTKPNLGSQLNHLQKGINAENTLLYFQNQGGGGLALGLMGPFGVLANMKMIEAKTDNEIAQLKGKPLPDPHTGFQVAADSVLINVQSENQASSQDILITPVILISKTTPEIFNISSIAFFEGGSGKDKWTHRYQYQLPGQYTLEQLTHLSQPQVDAIQQQTTSGFVAILKQLSDETDASIALEKKIIFESAYVQPRWTYEMLGSLAGEKDGRVWVRTYGGLTAIDPKDVQFRAQ